LKKSKNKNEKQIRSIEQDTAELIQFLGDIILKSVSKGETEVSKSGIDNLIEIAQRFLKLKEENENKYKVEKTRFFGIRNQKNQYISYVTLELEKIFNEALKQHDSITSRHIILQLSKILDSVMRGKNNWFILEDLIDSRNVLGSTYTKLITQSLENGTSLENNLLTQHLVSIPQYAVMERRYDYSYVKMFIDYHIFRVFKLIIEYKNLQAFTDAVEHFFSSLQFKDPDDIIRRLHGSFYQLAISARYLDDKETLEELTFYLKYLSVKNFENIPKLFEKLDSFHKSSEANLDEPQRKILQSRFDRIYEQLMELQISSLIHGVFFRIGALLLSNGSNYYHYIHELWYYGKSEFDSGTVINSTPVSSSSSWNILYTIYSGEGSTLIDEFYLFEDFPDATHYHYLYGTLLMVKSNSVFKFDLDRIEKIKDQDQKEEFDFYYELASVIKIEEFQEALRIISNDEELQKIIRVPDVKSNIENVKNKLKILHEQQSKVLDLLIRHGKLSSAKINEVKEKIRGHYFKGTISDKIAAVSYDENLAENDCITKEGIIGIRRDHFIKQNFMGMFLMDPVISPLAHYENLEILKFLQTKIEPIHQDTIEFVEQIRSSIINLKNKKQSPNIIFVPLDIEMELLKHRLVDFRETRRLKIDDTELHIVNSWNKFDFDDIIIFDSNHLKMTYKSNNKEQRIQIKESDQEGKTEVSFHMKSSFKIEITDSEAFYRIINQNIMKLKSDKDSS